jgi:hypothetical protein
MKTAKLHTKAAWPEGKEKNSFCGEKIMEDL